MAMAKDQEQKEMARAISFCAQSGLNLQRFYIPVLELDKALCYTVHVEANEKRRGDVISNGYLQHDRL
jgi:hypothetical protein